MTKNYLIIILLLIPILSFSQTPTQEKYAQELFENIQKYDYQRFTKLFPDEKTYSQMLMNSGEIDARYADDLELFTKGNYYQMMFYMINSFLNFKLESNNYKLNEYKLKAFRWNDKPTSKNELNHHNLWLCLTNSKNKSLVVTINDILEFKGKFYGAELSDINNLTVPFDTYVQEQINYQNEIVEAVADTAVAVEVAAPYEEEVVKVLNEDTYVTNINGKTITLKYLVYDYNDYIDFSNCSYFWDESANTNQGPTFDLKNGNIVLIDEEVGETISFNSQTLKGTLFSSKNNQSYPLTFKKVKSK